MKDYEKNIRVTGDESVNHAVTPAESQDGFVAPFRIGYETNETCNMECGFCFADYNEGATVHNSLGIPTLGQLNTTEVKGMLDQAAKIGVKQFLFGGGDPFIRSDMSSLIEHASDAGLQVVVDTNGLILSNRKGLLEKVAPRIHQLGLSLDGSSAQTHDAFRATRHSFDAAIDLIERSKDFNYKLKINTIVTAENAEDIPNMVDVLAPSCKQIDRWSLDQFIPFNRGELNQDRYLISNEAYTDVVEKVKALAIERFDASVIGGGLKENKAGTVMLFGPQGIPYVIADGQMRYVEGNIRTQSLSGLVKKAQDKGLDLEKMNKQRYGEAYYVSTKKDS